MKDGALRGKDRKGKKKKKKRKNAARYSVVSIWRKGFRE